MEHVERRPAQADAAGLILLAWGLLLLAMSAPKLVGAGLADPFVSLVGVVFGAAHLGAAIGVATRAEWARGLGLGVAIVGLFGTLSVLGIMLGAVGAVIEMDPGSVPVFLAIPATMALSYGVAFWLLLRNR